MALMFSMHISLSTVVCTYEMQLRSVSYKNICYESEPYLPVQKHGITHKNVPFVSVHV
jgi:hypothetical protein